MWPLSVERKMESLFESYLPEGTFALLQAGSYEDRINQVERFVESCVTSLFEGSPAVVVATFDDHVVVTSVDGRFKKVFFERSDSVLKMLQTEDMDVPVYQTEDLEAMVREVADKAAKSIKEGNSVDTQKHLATLMELRETVKTVVTDSKIESLVTYLESMKPWKKAIESLRLTLNCTPQTKRLVDLSESQEAESGDVDTIVEGLISLRDSLVSVPKSKLRKLPENLATAVKIIQVDLKEDLGRTIQLTQECVKNLSGSGPLGIVYKVLADELSEYSVASDLLRIVGSG